MTPNQALSAISGKIAALCAAPGGHLEHQAYERAQGVIRDCINAIDELEPATVSELSILVDLLGASKRIRNNMRGREGQLVKGADPIVALIEKAHDEVVNQGMKPRTNVRLTNVVDPKTAIDEAREIIYGDREETYGHPSVNLERIARLWSVLFGIEVTARQVALAQILVKIAREVNAEKHDNVVDIIGYAALIDRLNEKDGQGSA